jgi:hypothetical protein
VALISSESKVKTATGGTITDTSKTSPIPDVPTSEPLSPPPPAPVAPAPAPIMSPVAQNPSIMFSSPPAPTAAPGPAPTASASTSLADMYKAHTGTVDDSMLVQNQMNNILSDNSQYIQQARARAAQTANARGMMNGSLAAQAGEEAAISQALPIAQQDANTNFTNMRDNTAALNQYGLADKTNSLQEIMQGRDMDNRLLMGRESNAAQLQAAQTHAAATVSAAAMQAETQRYGIDTNSKLESARMKQQDDQFYANMKFVGGENELNRQLNLKMQGNELTSRLDITNLNISAQTKWNMANMSQSSLNSFGAAASNIFSSNMSAEDKGRYFNNLLAIWAGNPSFPYQPTSGAYTPAPPPPAPAPAPNAVGSEGKVLPTGRS